MGSEFEPQGLVHDDEIKSMGIVQDLRNRCYRATLEAKGVTVRALVDERRLQANYPYNLAAMEFVLMEELKKQVEIATWPV